MEAGWRETPALRRSELSGGNREEAGKAETVKGQRDTQRQKQRQPSVQLSRSTDLKFTADTGVACSLEVDTGVGEAETRESMRKYI